MSRWYSLMYKLGFTPWEEDTASQLAQLQALLGKVECDRSRPYGSALDLGCGTGRFSVELARRGWQVVGVDVISNAIEMARQRARSAKVDVKFVQGDVSDLERAQVGSGFSLILDAECFNHLSDDQRMAVGRGVSAVAAPDATLLILVWRRAHRWPLPPGATRGDLERCFPQWRIRGDWPYEAPLPSLLKRVKPRWYLLSRA